MGLQDQILVKWNDWDREKDMTWEPRKKIDHMGDNWKHRVCVLEAEYRACEETRAERARAVHQEE
eukprot:5486832-Pleurochrysis_carterae.AAC.3